MSSKKVLIEKISGYNIWGEINPKNNKLYNFSVTGVGISPNTTYVHLSDAEKTVKHLTGAK